MKSNDIYKAILALKNEDEVKAFFYDIMTPQENHALKERWEIVKALIEGKESQRDIAKRLGSGIATVTRGNRTLKYGEGSLQTIYDRLKKK